MTSDTSGNVSAAESHILQTGQKVICAWLVQIGAGLSVGNVSLNTRGRRAVRQAGRQTPCAAESKHTRLSSQNSSDGAQRPQDELSPCGHSCSCSSLKYVFRATKVSWLFFFFLGFRSYLNSAPPLAKVLGSSSLLPFKTRYDTYFQD